MDDQEVLERVLFYLSLGQIADAMGLIEDWFGVHENESATYERELAYAG